MPQVFDSATINRFAQQAEDDFVTDYDCLIDRFAITAVAGNPLYELPDYVKNVHRITWKGLKIDPMPHRKFRDNNLSNTASGKPQYYIFNNVGQNTIRFFPIPSENVSAIQTNLFTSEIPNRVIVQFFRAPDYSIHVLPDFFRRRLIKAYVMYRCFQIEGKGQNMKASQYWESKYEFLKQTYGALLEDLINTPRKIILGRDHTLMGNSPARPSFPEYANGIGVDAGE